MSATLIPIRDANYAVEALRALITSTDWSAAGGKIPTERDLAQQFDLGRHAVRRALEVLEAEGLIWRRQGAGTFVGPQTADSAMRSPRSDAIAARATFDEIMEVRLRIEPQIAQLAAMRATDEDIDRMRIFNIRCRDAIDPEACELWDGAFHRQLAVAAKNSMFLSLFDVVNRVRQDKLWQHTRDFVREGTDAGENTFTHHQAIIKAVDARDPVGAAHAMRDHMLNIQMRLLQRLTSIEGF